VTNDDRLRQRPREPYDAAVTSSQRHQAGHNDDVTHASSRVHPLGVKTYTAQPQLRPPPLSGWDRFSGRGDLAADGRGQTNQLAVGGRGLQPGDGRGQTGQGRGDLLDGRDRADRPRDRRGQTDDKPRPSLMDSFSSRLGRRRRHRTLY